MPQALRAPLQPLNNTEYRNAVSAGSVAYPTWWGANGGRLIPLESGTGTRIQLTAFYNLTRALSLGCDYVKGTRDRAFDPTAFSWRMWLYGGYYKVTPLHCSKARDFQDFLFYATHNGAEPLPVVDFGELVGSAPAINVSKDSVTVYVTRELTQQMNIGMFYLGVVVMESDKYGNAITLPPGMTPAEAVRSRPRLPPMWMFLQDASRHFHGRFEDIPKGRGIPCP